MGNASITLILLVVCSNAFASEDVQEFKSPDSSCTIVYKGPGRGEGTFYNKTNMNILFIKDMSGMGQ